MADMTVTVTMAAEEFVEFLDNVESKNYHIKTALQVLNT